MTNLFKDFHKPISPVMDLYNIYEVEKLVTENAALKEQVAQQAEQIAGLIATNATLDAEWKKTTTDKFAGMAEAIRLKDAALEKIACIGNGDTHGNTVGNCLAIDALLIQPSPEIIQARDEKVADTCAKVVDDVIDTFGIHSLVGVVKAKIRSGEWRKYL